MITNVVLSKCDNINGTLENVFQGTFLDYHLAASTQRVYTHGPDVAVGVTWLVDTRCGIFINYPVTPTWNDGLDLGSLVLISNYHYGSHMIDSYVGTELLNGGWWQDVRTGLFVTNFRKLTTASYEFSSRLSKN